ncbi:MAG TPA: PadR family transcriptional regulator [Allosphingosinicella sp.]
MSEPPGEIETDVSDHEAVFLALVLRLQPVTAYEVSRVYEDSPIDRFSTSKGKIYPLIQRLAKRGLIAKEKVSGDARGTERLRATDRGREAVRRWTLRIEPGHFILEDPLRTKMQSFDLLTGEERMEWVLAARQGLEEQLERLDAYGNEVTVPFHDWVHDNAVRSLRARIAWLDRVLARMLRAGEGLRHIG